MLRWSLVVPVRNPLLSKERPPVALSLWLGLYLGHRARLCSAFNSVSSLEKGRLKMGHCIPRYHLHSFLRSTPFNKIRIQKPKPQPIFFNYSGLSRTKNNSDKDSYQMLLSLNHRASPLLILAKTDTWAHRKYRKYQKPIKIVQNTWSLTIVHQTAPTLKTT